MALYRIGIRRAGGNALPACVGFYAGRTPLFGFSGKDSAYNTRGLRCVWQERRSFAFPQRQAHNATTRRAAPNRRNDVKSALRGRADASQSPPGGQNPHRGIFLTNCEVPEKFLLHFKSVSDIIFSFAPQSDVFVRARDEREVAGCHPGNFRSDPTSAAARTRAKAHVCRAVPNTRHSPGGCACLMKKETHGPVYRPSKEGGVQEYGKPHSH